MKDNEQQAPDQRLAEIRERWASIPVMDAGTSDNGKKCVAYLYEKDFPHKLIATMADLYDMARLNALAKSKDDIDYLLSLLAQPASERCGKCGHAKSQHERYPDHDECLGCRGVDEPCCGFVATADTPKQPLPTEYVCEWLGPITPEMFASFPPTEATQVAVEAAAREIAERWMRGELPLEAQLHSLRHLQLQALVLHVIPKHCSADAGEVERLNQRIAELERRLKIPFGKFPCALCGGPHDFDTSVPSVIWNNVIRAKGLPDYLCTTCIVREFVRTGQGFTAELWNEEFNGVPIEVVVNGQNAKDASAVQEENNSLRNQLSTARADAIRECVEKICEFGIQWNREAQDPRADLKNLIGVRARAMANAAGNIVTALESLAKEGDGTR